MKIKYLKKIMAICVAAFCILAGVSVVSADNNGSIEFYYIKGNIKICIYKVASGEEKKLEDDFSKYSVSLEDKGSAIALASYVQRDNIAPFASKNTDADNKAFFKNLSKGYYLITGDSFVNNGIKYTLMPVIVDVSDHKVEVNGKYEKEGGSSGNKQLGVMKVWSGSKGEPEVVAQLLRNGVVFEEVKLNQQNNWRYTWFNLDSKYEWSVVEKEIPVKYQVKIEKDGNVYVIINKYEPDKPHSHETTVESTETTTSGYVETTVEVTTNKPKIPRGGGHIPHHTTTTTEATMEITTIGTPSNYDSEITTDYTEAPTSNDSIEYPTNDNSQPLKEFEFEVSTENNTEDIEKNGTQLKENTTPKKNTPSKENKPSKPEKLPQTGQFWIPVPILSFLGMLFIVFGMDRRRWE